MKKLAILISVFYIWQACRHEPICEQVPHDTTGFGWNYKMDSSYYGQPCFNPMNPDEIIFHQIQGFTYSEVWKLNLKSHEKTLLVGNEFKPRISSWAKDWILVGCNVNGEDNIWKVKSPGDSLTQLTFGGHFFDISVNGKLDGFLVGKGIYSDKTFLYDLNGDLLDSFPFNGDERTRWNSKEQFLYKEQPGVSTFVFDVNQRTSNEISLSSYYNGVSGMAFINNDEIVWADVNGMHQTNINTMKTTQLKATCDSEYYRFPTYSPQLNKVIWEKMTIRVEGSSLFKRAHIVMMNPDGSGEEEIDIPR